MQIYLQLVLAFFALGSLVPGAKAQFIWNVLHSDITDQTQFSFNQISCKGNNCTVGLTQTDLLNFKSIIVLYQSTDAGVTWTSEIPAIHFSFTFTNSGFTHIQRIDSLNIVATGDSGLIIRSFDAGSTWEKQDCHTTNTVGFVHFSDPQTGILTCGGLRQVRLTSDGGRHWDTAAFNGIGIKACHSYGNGKFRLFKYGWGPIYTTTDNFKTIDSTQEIFDSLNNPDWYKYVFTNCTFGDGDTVLAYGNYAPNDTLYLRGNEGLMIRSVDGGKHWEKPNTFPITIMSVITNTTELDRDTILAGGFSSNKILFSSDRGFSWRVDSLLLDTAYMASGLHGISMIGKGDVIASFGSGALSNEQTILIRGVKEKLSVYDMIAYNTHIYPNPATGIVNIVSIDRSDPVHIIDVLGREVLNGVLSGDGKIMLDFSPLPKGMYTVSLDHRGKRVLVGKVAILGR